MKNELKEKLLPLYEKLIQNFQPADLDRLSIFKVQVGSQWKKGESILFVGRALNGGNHSLSIKDLFSSEKTNSFLLDVFNNTEYNINKSAFWRIIRKIEDHYGNNDVEWYEKTAWSNLCKLAPEQGNPNNNDFYRQEKICREILLTEIEILQPKAVILLTYSWDILDIENIFELIDKKEWKKYSSYLYKYNDVYYIYTPHPQGKSEQEHKEAICNLLEKIK
ncbi:hypothetical protein B0187_07710 [Haemophilus paracuniculus]|uniref:Uracil-DNA glycosylase-like domain-containing protein n=1 Tax=Haemophilus paracuniculus TaxID=734 RepID=A0A1T0AR23_9PAST|nr:uracil-DNA glycosylase family protein [Haemophilus paracuniculus]OOR98757.1 hypothetical protein B0187_07710 [Haemophilus paracuniculus]